MAAPANASIAGGTSEVTYDSELSANDTVSVHVARKAPGFFAKLFGIDSVDVGANATARASGLTAARWVALTGLSGARPEDDDVRSAHRGVVTDPATRSIVTRLLDWTDDQHLSGHQSPAFGPHLLGLLAEGR